MAKSVKFKITGMSPMSQSKYIQAEKKPKETAKDYEERTWKNRLHSTKDGVVFIPQMAIKNCLSEAAKFLSLQIPGKGKATYTKHFEAGILCLEAIPVMHEDGRTPMRIDDIDGEWLFVPSDGRRGGGSRVEKCFPVIDAGWKAEGEVLILDDTITEDVLHQHFREAGSLIGIGRFRPRNNGFYGRFRVDSLEWSEYADG